MAVRCSIRRCPHPTEAVWSRVKMKISRIEKGNMDEKGYSMIQLVSARFRSRRIMEYKRCVLWKTFALRGSGRTRRS